MRSRLALLFAAVVILLAGGCDTDDDRAGPRPIPAVPSDPDQQLEPVEQKQADTKREGVGIHEDSRDELPPGVTPEEVERGQDYAELEAETRLGEPQEPAGAQAYSCPARPVINQSALSGRRLGVALHFTVSQPGSLDAIRGLFNRRSFGASSNYGFELFNLRCQQWVPDNRKAWCQGAANSAYNCIEIITNDRSRASWLGSPAINRGILAALVADLLKRHGAPPNLVDPVGCNWKAGVTDHDRLECGNTHWDVGKNFPWDVFMAQVRRAYFGLSPRPLPVRYGLRCRQYRHLERKRQSRLDRKISPTLSDAERVTFRKLRAGFKASRRVECQKSGKAART
jgi:hypothetical protein